MFISRQLYQITMMSSQTLVLAFCYFVLLLVILPIFCSNKVYSIFYQEDADINAKIDQIKNESRKRGLVNYLQTVNSSESLSFHSTKLTESVDNLIIIIAKNPSNKDDLILSQLVTELDRNIQQEIVYKNAFLVCNASRVDFEELVFLSKFYPVRQSQNTSIWKMFNKEEIIKHDFVDCITLGINQTQAKYITVIRDVVVPYSGFLQSLNHVICTQITNTIRRGDLHSRESSWLFLHLHEPVPLRHFCLSFICVRELFLIAGTGSMIFYWVFRYLEGKNHTFFPAFSFIFFGAIYFLTFALVIGRPYISELRRGISALHTVYDTEEPVHFSAISLPMDSAKELMLHLNEIRCSTYAPFHKVLDQMVNTLQKPAFVISPSLVKYVVKT